MRTYCQKTQDAAEELQLFAINTGSLYAYLLRAQRRTRDRFKADPDTSPSDLKDSYGGFYAKALDRYLAEIGSHPNGNRAPAVRRCAMLIQAADDLDELKTNPAAFDFITDEAIARHLADYARR